MSFSAKVMKDGPLKKRSSGLLQLWKKKRYILIEDGLRLHNCKVSGGALSAPSSGFVSKAKELQFEPKVTVDCVEYKRGLVYFTVVMSTGKEIDLSLSSAWHGMNAEIASALMQKKNFQAVQTRRNRQLLSTSHIGNSDEDEAL